MIDLRKRWILEGLALVAAGMALVGWIAWEGLHRGVALQARVGAGVVLDQFQSDAARSFRRGETLARAVQARLARADLFHLQPDTLLELTPFLEKDGPVTSLMVYEATGRILFLNRVGDGWKLYLHHWDQGGRKSFFGTGRTWVAAVDPDFPATFQARQRPWYAWAESHTAPGWMTTPYRFPDGETVGYSYVIPLRPGGPGTPLHAVIAADIALAPYVRDLWSQGRQHHQNLVALTQDDRVIIPAWHPGLASDPALLRAAILAPFQGPPRPVLLSRTVKSPGLPAARLLLLEPEGGLPISPWAMLVFLGLPVLATGILLGIFVWRHHRRVVAPLSDLAEAGAHPGVAPALPPRSQRVRQLRDLDERLSRARVAEDDRQSLQNRLETMQRADTVGALAPGIVHDANNQLAVAVGQLALVSDLLQDHPELEPHLEKARGAALKCSEVLRALLAYSRPQPGAQATLDLGLIVQETAGMLLRVLGRDVDLRLEIAPEPIWIQGERVKLEQVIVNLALNARDALPQGGRLVLRTRPRGAEALLEVEDGGTGMPEAVKRRLFEPFFTTKAPGRGTGLGLAMVANIVEGMGGKIAVTSTEGLGTTFTLSFPSAAPLLAGGGAPS